MRGTFTRPPATHRIGPLARGGPAHVAQRFRRTFVHLPLRFTQPLRARPVLLRRPRGIPGAYRRTATEPNPAGREARANALECIVMHSRTLALAIACAACSGDPFVSIESAVGGAGGAGGERSSDPAATASAGGSGSTAGSSSSSGAEGGATASSSSSSGEACSFRNCNGCCSEGGACLAGNEKAACGLAGDACVPCQNYCTTRGSNCAPTDVPAVQQLECIDHACKEVSYPMCCPDPAYPCDDATGACAAP